MSGDEGRDLASLGVGDGDGDQGRQAGEEDREEEQTIGQQGQVAVDIISGGGSGDVCHCGHGLFCVLRRAAA